MLSSLRAYGQRAMHIGGVSYQPLSTFNLPTSSSSSSSSSFYRDERLSVPRTKLLRTFFSSRFALLLLLPFLFTLFLFRSELHYQSLQLFNLHPVEAIQQKAYSISGEKRHLECKWTVWHDQRYASLAHTNTTTTTTEDNGHGNGNVFMAMNFYDNEGVLPTFFQELPVILRFLGPRRVYVSIYENGSKDKTPKLLRLLGDMLDVLGTPHQIITLGSTVPSHKEDGHRISFLADARNKILEPLYSGKAARRVPGHQFADVFFMNDVAHCAADMIEVLYQKRMQEANQACAVDWGGWGGQVVYDRWVLRSMSGKPWYHREEIVEYVEGPKPADGKDKPYAKPLPDVEDVVDRERFVANLPMQVFSCWNGATVFDAAAFLPPHNIRFRTARSDLDEDGVPKVHTELASECYLSSVDLWKAGLGKIALIPKASVSYGVHDYWAYRKDGPLPASHDPATELIQWKSEPPARVALQDYADWRGPERWAPWDEP